MGHFKTLLLALILAWFAGWVKPQAGGMSDLTGKYVMKSQGGEVVLTLKQEFDKITGTVRGFPGTTFRLRGQLGKDGWEGSCSEGSKQVFFEIKSQGDTLLLKLIEPDEVNTPDYNQVTNLVFQRQSSDEKATPTPVSATKGGTDRISDPQLGISFLPPTGWTSERSGRVYVLRTASDPGLLLILPHSVGTLAQLNAKVTAGLVDEASGIQLRPLEALQQYGPIGMAGNLGGTSQGKNARGYAIGLLAPAGGGVIVVAAAEATRFTAAHSALVRTIVGSVRFVTQQADRALIQWFAGKYSTFAKIRDDDSESEKAKDKDKPGSGSWQVMFCLSGVFYGSLEADAARHKQEDVNLGSASGRWAVLGDRSQGVLRLVLPDGSIREVSYQAAGQSRALVLGGKTFNFEGPANCN